MEALLHKRCVLPPTSVIDVSDGHDHFLIHDVYSVQGQVITVLEKWITQVTKGINKSFNIFLNVTCELWDVWDGSWWEVKEWMEGHSNSWIIRDISGPATIHLLSAAGFPLSPTASPSPQPEHSTVHALGRAPCPEKLFLFYVRQISQWSCTIGCLLTRQSISLNWLVKLHA